MKYEKINFFEKSLDKIGGTWYNSCRNKEKFRFHLATACVKVNTVSSLP